MALLNAMKYIHLKPEKCSLHSLEKIIVDGFLLLYHQEAAVGTIIYHLSAPHISICHFTIAKSWTMRVRNN
jgi:uncharacterized membrane protein YpjA